MNAKPPSSELLELSALVGLAWEQRGQEGFRAAVEAVVDWHDRRDIRAHERRKLSNAAVLEVLRETASPAQKEWIGTEPPIPVGG